MTIEEAMKKQKLAIKNIRFLVKRQGKKLGDMEEWIGVTRGYFSRCDNDSEKRISLVLMIMAADYVETPLQDLMSGDMAKKLELADIETQLTELESRRIKLLREEE